MVIKIAVVSEAQVRNKYMGYGIGYKGSKNKIAEEILEQLPSGNRLVDLFGGGLHEVKILDKSNVRRLTPKECFRLMGFSDSDYEKAHSVCSDTQLYKQAGNSIVVDVLEAVLKELLKDEI